MVSPDEEPNVAFSDEATAFLDGQPLEVQAEVIAIACGLYFDPTPDGERTFYRPAGQVMGVRQYATYYVGERYFVYYEYQRSRRGDLLWVHDCGFV